MNIENCIEIMGSYVVPKFLLDNLDKILKKINMNVPNKNGIILSCSITKLLNSFVKIDNNIGIFVSTFLKQLSKNKCNYFTVFLGILSLNKKYGNSIKTKYFKYLYIYCISKIIYNWSFSPEKINRSLLKFLDKGSGLSKFTITKYREEMINNGWVSYKTSCPNNGIFDLLKSSLPRSFLHISRIIMFNELINFVIKKILNKRYKFNIKLKLNNITFLALVFQFPILMIAIFNKLVRDKKPSKLLINIWSILSGLPIFITNRSISKNVSLFLLTNLITNKINSSNINLPNSYLISKSSEYLLKDHSKKINKYISLMLNL